MRPGRRESLRLLSTERVTAVDVSFFLTESSIFGVDG